MNPLCLLTKGRTFKDMADRPGAYKLLAGSALPKLMPGKRPPSRWAHPAPPKAAQKSLFEQRPKPVPSPVVEARKSVVPPMEPIKRPKPMVSPFAQDYIKDVNPAAKPCTGGSWKRTVALGKIWLRRFVYGQKGRPVHGPTVQAELALEKVTVLRNNLNEDDMEVVLVERKVGTGEKPLARVSKMEMTGEAWLRLTAPFRKKNSESVFSSKAEASPSPELGARV